MNGQYLMLQISRIYRQYDDVLAVSQSQNLTVIFSFLIQNVIRKH